MIRDPILETLKNTLPGGVFDPNSLSQSFQKSIVKGDISSVKKAIHKGVDLNQSWGETNPLYLAIENKNEEIAILLFEKGSRLDQSNPKHHFLWKTVGESNNIKLAQILIDCHMNPGKADVWWNVCLWMKKSPEFIRFWLKKELPLDFGVSHFEVSEDEQFIPNSSFSLNIAANWIKYLLQNATKKESLLFQKKIKKNPFFDHCWNHALHDEWEELIRQDDVVMLHHYLNIGLKPPKLYESVSYSDRIQKKDIKIQLTKPSLPLNEAENYIKKALENKAFKTFAWFRNSPELMSQFIESCNTHPIPRILGDQDYYLIEELVKKGLDIKKCSPLGYTILHFVCIFSIKENLFVNQEKWFTLCADLLDVKNEQGVTPLDMMKLSKEEKEQILLNYRVNKASTSVLKPLRL